MSIPQASTRTLPHLTMKIIMPGTLMSADLYHEQVIDYMKSRYGLEIESVRDLPSYDDRNFHVMVKKGSLSENSSIPQDQLDYENGYVLKGTNIYDSKNRMHVEGQVTLMLDLNKKGNILCPKPIRHKNATYVAVDNIGRYKPQHHLFRLFNYIPGKTLDKVDNITDDFLVNLGKYAAKLTKHINEDSTVWDHPGYRNHWTIWGLTPMDYVKDYMSVLEIDDNVEFDLICKMINDVNAKVNVSIVNNELPMAVVHGDLNDTNIIVTDDEKDVKAVLDFGDSHRGPFVWDLSTIMTYMLLRLNSLERLRFMVDGYQSLRKLIDAERRELKLMIIARLVQSFVINRLILYEEKDFSLPEVQYEARSMQEKHDWAVKLYEMEDSEFRRVLGIPMAEE